MRPDGLQVKIVAQAVFGRGLSRSTDTYVLEGPSDIKQAAPDNQPKEIPNADQMAEQGTQAGSLPRAVGLPQGRASNARRT